MSLCPGMRRKYAGGHDGPDLPAYRPQLPAQPAAASRGPVPGITSDLAVYQTNMELLYDALTRLGFEV